VQAVGQARQYWMETFVEKDLPPVFRSMCLLGMSPEDLAKSFEKYKKQHFNR
jgi:hypothetical protein